MLSISHTLTFSNALSLSQTHSLFLKRTLSFSSLSFLIIRDRPLSAWHNPRNRSRILKTKELKTHLRCGDICQNESSMLKKMLFPTPLLSSCSVTRCGKILQLWQHFLNLCEMVEGLFCVWANFWTYFSNIVMCFWPAFSMLYMANLKNYRHLVTLSSCELGK